MRLSYLHLALPWLMHFTACSAGSELQLKQRKVTPPAVNLQRNARSLKACLHECCHTPALTYPLSKQELITLTLHRVVEA